jgi:hypothetical protein
LHVVFELLPFPALELMELFKISKSLSWGLEARFLSVDSLSKKLLSRYLDGAGRLVLDPWRTAR